MFFEWGRTGSDSVWGLSFGTIVFLGIWEAAKIMSRSLKLAPSPTSLRQLNDRLITRLPKCQELQ